LLQPLQAVRIYIEMPKFTCYNLAEKKVGDSLEIIFPGFDARRERVVFLSPHDDDAVLGAGYLINACRLEAADAHIVVLCDGRAGYTRPEMKESIVDIRRSEARLAYAKLGIKKDRIHCFEYPDFSLQAYLGFELTDGTEGVFGKIVKLLREIKATRLVIPNGWMEHPDHTAAHEIGAFHGPQVGDPILPDRGTPSKIKSFVVYPVWGDLPPSQLGCNDAVRADLMMVAPVSFEKKIRKALECFKSQSDVIADLLCARSGRIRDRKAIEVYKRLVPRPRIDYDPYWKAVENITTVSAKS